jgi:hypothetical protein
MTGHLSGNVLCSEHPIPKCIRYSEPSVLVSKVVLQVTSLEVVQELDVDLGAKVEVIVQYVVQGHCQMSS